MYPVCSVTYLSGCSDPEDEGGGTANGGGEERLPDPEQEDVVALCRTVWHRGRYADENTPAAKWLAGGIWRSEQVGPLPPSVRWVSTAEYRSIGEDRGLPRLPSEAVGAVLFGWGRRGLADPAGLRMVALGTGTRPVRDRWSPWLGGLAPDAAFMSPAGGPLLDAQPLLVCASAVMALGLSVRTGLTAMAARDAGALPGLGPVLAERGAPVQIHCSAREEDMASAAALEAFAVGAGLACTVLSGPPPFWLADFLARPGAGRGRRSRFESGR